MDYDGLIALYDDLIRDFPVMLLDATEVASLDLLALADQRISQTGTDKNGAPFEDYSFDYKKRKTKLGRYRGIVDFTFSGQMLASTTTGFENIVPSSKSVSGSVAVVAYDGRDQLTRDKLTGNDKKRPGFLLPSKAEIGRVTPLAQARLEKQIKARFQ